MITSKNLLIIGMVWPEPTSSAAGVRIIQLIQLYLDWSYTVVFASAASKSEHSFDLKAIGVFEKEIALNDTGFDIFIKELHPNIVLFDRYITEEQFGWRVAENCPGALRILDTEDLHFLRLARQDAFKKQISFTDLDLQTDTAKREIASIYRCDLSLIISEYEMDLLQQDFDVPNQLLYYLPFLHSETSQDLKPFEERFDFVFIGNFWHDPNWDAVRFLKEEIWSLIKTQLPKAKLLIYGAYMSEKVTQLHNPASGFCVMGRAESSVAVIQNARVLIAPLRFGAGAKGKLLEAMQCGTPSVTTTIGAESMSGDLPWNGIIANDATEIANTAVQLYTDKIMWQKAQDNGFEIIQKRYAKSLFVTDFKSRINFLSENLNTHRKSNFIGQMLLHHTLKSTKYLSKWIEEKNRN